MMEFVEFTRDEVAQHKVMCSILVTVCSLCSPEMLTQGQWKLQEVVGAVLVLVVDYFDFQLPS